MAFWGIEVKSGKPYTHRYEDARGRLRVCQATLGDGKGTTRTVVQCNVGEKSPILICSLIPNASETCHLELEFEEDDEVVFSVIGERSVHLSGYYTESSAIKVGDDEDSYGEDIAETDSDASESYDVGASGDDEYESDFIDDDDNEMFPSSAPWRNGVVIEEIIEDDKPSNENGTLRRLRKKHQVSDTEDGGDDSQQQLVLKPAAPAVVESEDEDGFPLLFSVSKKNAGENAGTVKELSEKTNDGERKRKIDAIDQDSKSERDKLLSSDYSRPSLVDTENTGKKKKKTKDRRPLETVSVKKGQEDIAVGDKEVVFANGVKSNKKKKEKTEEGKASETRAESLSEETQRGAKGDTSEAGNTDTINLDNSAEAEKLPDNKDEKSSQKLKKKKRKAAEGDIFEVQGGSPVGIAEERDQLLNEEKINKVSDSSADGAQQEPKKKKKKKSKNDGNDLSNSQGPAKVEAEDKKKTLKTRTFGNGLIIEELSMGKPDGKRASPGNKISVNYIGKLEKGKIFDSNVGQRPFKFRLGVGQVIKGWDVGINGMRVGDKRRLTIPPAMGYGDKNAGTIPKNSWLLFDVELVDVQSNGSK